MPGAKAYAEQLGRDGGTGEPPQRVPDGGKAAGRNDRPVLVAFAFLVLFGGANAVAVRISNAELAPFWGAGLRFAASAVVLWLILIVRRVRLPRGHTLGAVALYGLLAVGASYAFLYLGLQRVPASLTMVVLALVPLMTLLLAWVHGLERVSSRRIIGALVAVTGIVLVVSEGLRTGVPILSLLAPLAGAACLAEGAVILKLAPGSHPVATNALSFTIGAALLLGLSLATGEPRAVPTTLPVWLALGYLVVFGSIVMFYLYLTVLSRWAASATAYAFLLFPLATVPIAALLAGESITLSFIVGGVLGLFGVWFGALSGARTAPSAGTSPASERRRPPRGQPPLDAA